MDIYIVVLNDLEESSQTKKNGFQFLQELAKHNDIALDGFYSFISYQEPSSNGM